jgi:hypothetical protein
MLPLNGKKDMNARIADGIRIAKSAAANGDVKLLRDCLTHFITLNVPVEKIYEAIEDCPVGLLDQAGFYLTIRSELLGAEIVLGRDIPWEEISMLLGEGVKGEALKTVLETRHFFGGKVLPKDSPTLFDKQT